MGFEPDQDSLVACTSQRSNPLGHRASSTMSCFFFGGRIRNDDQAPVRDPASPAWFLPCFRFAMLLLCDVADVLHWGLPRFRSHALSPVNITHCFTISHTPSLILWRKERCLRRTTNPSSCLVVFSSARILCTVHAQSNWFATSDGRCTIMWFDPFLVRLR